MKHLPYSARGLLLLILVLRETLDLVRWRELELLLLCEPVDMATGRLVLLYVNRQEPAGLRLSHFSDFHFSPADGLQALVSAFTHQFLCKGSELRLLLSSLTGSGGHTALLLDLFEDVLLYLGCLHVVLPQLVGSEELSSILSLQNVVEHAALASFLALASGRLLRDLFFRLEGMLFGRNLLVVLIDPRVVLALDLGAESLVHVVLVDDVPIHSELFDRHLELVIHETCFGVGVDVPHDLDEPLVGFVQLVALHGEVLECVHLALRALVVLLQADVHGFDGL